jgi:AraC-like DNA-binding protein
MTTPILFLTDDMLANPLITLSSVDPNTRDYLLAGSQKKMYAANHIRILQQSFAGTGCCLMRFDFFQSSSASSLLQCRTAHTGILYVLRQSIVARNDDGLYTDMKEGFCYLLNLEAMQKIATTLAKGHTQLLYVALDESYLEHLEFVDPAMSRLRNTIIEGARITHTLHLQLDMITAYKGDLRRFKTFMRARILDIVLSYLDTLDQKNQAGILNKNERLFLAKKIIDNNEGRRIPVNMLCRKVGMSATDLQHGFRELFGSSVDHYQLKKRMEKAADLLISEPLASIEAIATRVGYSEESSFIKIFHRTFGSTPLQYRKRFLK